MLWQIKLAIGVFLLVVASYFYFDYTHAKAEKARLEQEVLKANTTIEGLNSFVKQQQLLIESERESINEIDNTPANQDGPIAPVLRRTLNRL